MRPMIPCVTPKVAKNSESPLYKDQPLYFPSKLELLITSSHKLNGYDARCNKQQNLSLQKCFQKVFLIDLGKDRHANKTLFQTTLISVLAKPGTNSKVKLDLYKALQSSNIPCLILNYFVDEKKKCSIFRKKSKQLILLLSKIFDLTVVLFIFQYSLKPIGME